VSNPSVGGMRFVRSRLAYAVAAAIVIALGLASRWDAIGLQWFVAKYSGDALWALVVFIGMAFVFPKRSTPFVTALAAGFACVVEFSQLYHPPWLDAIRATVPGGLVLGTPSSSFAWGDIVAYLVGIACGVLTELILSRKHAGDRAKGSL
jgi:hypothetical protein